MCLKIIDKYVYQTDSFVIEENIGHSTLRKQTIELAFLVSQNCVD